MFSFDLLVNAVVAGILLGGFYAAVSLGISVTFGLLDVANIAHPVFIIAGAYAVYAVNTAFALDPILAGLLFTPLFYGLGVVIYRIYYVSFERAGEQSLRGLVFFFGLLFIAEVALILAYGVDYRLIEAPYIGRSVSIGPIGISLRLGVPCVVGLLLTLALYLFSRKPSMARPSWVSPRTAWRSASWERIRSRSKLLPSAWGWPRRALPVRCSLSLA